MMKKYDSYKNSGIEWIGDVPEHWVSKKLKYIFDTVIGGAWGDEPMSNVNDMVVFRVADFDYNKGLLSTENLTIRNIPENQQSKRVLKYGDIVLEKSGGGEKTPVGRAVMYTHEQIQAVCANFCNRLSPKYGYSPAFINYLLKYLYIRGVTLKYINQSTGIQNLQSEALLNEVVFIPAFDEQNLVADFLDKKTAKIDSLIQKKQQMITLLEEEKISIINKTVTKGLNPNALMIDSGMEWVSTVPAHWKVVPLRYVGECQNGVSEGADYFGSGYPFVSYGDVYKNVSLPKSVAGLAKSTESDRERFSVKEGDVFFTRTSETVDEIGIASTCMESIDDAVFAGFLIRFRPTDQYLFKGFSKYFFRSQAVRTYFVKEMNLVTRASLSQELLKRLPVLLPPYDEQQKISSYLDHHLDRIRGVIIKAFSEIKLLQEYRTALISEAVTGKIDVRDYQPEPITSPALA